MSQPTDLSFATFDELVDELKKRSDGLVVVALLKADKGYPVKLRFGGHRLVQRGLIADAADWTRSPAFCDTIDMDHGRGQGADV